VTFGSGSSGVSGAVSASNSLVGSTAGDLVGSGRVTALSNGNYVVDSPDWSNGSASTAGAVTFGSGSSGVSGAVSASNSLVGSTARDFVGALGVTALSNGNYMVDSSLWSNGSASKAGAVTFGSGTSGVSGAVSASNSLVGSTASDQVGYGGVTALSNGNYVVDSPNWSNGALSKAGAATLGNGSSGVSGPVSASNSLVGTSADAGLQSPVVIDTVNGNFFARFLSDTGGGGGGHVRVGALRQPPTVTVPGTQAAVTVNEGSPATNTGTFDDAEGRSTVTLSASLGTVTKNDATGTWRWSYTPPDSTATPTTVTITATDSGGLTASTTFTLTVNNVRPTITAFTVPASGTAGSPLALSAAASDPAGALDPLTYTWTITRPDGSTLTLAGATVGFTPADVGSYSVRLTVSDGDGGTTTQSAVIAVTPAPLNVLGVEINDGSAQRSMVTSITLTFDNPVTSLDPHAIEVRQGVTSLFPTDLTIVGNQVIVRFTGLPGVVGGSLADGVYTLIEHQALIHAGPNRQLLVDRADAFFRLFGDSNGDGRVDDTDRTAFLAAYRSRKGMANYRSFFDFNGDGVIDSTDYFEFLRRLGTSV
jgi:hypothetical protein